jgi:hypothetical protein
MAADGDSLSSPSHLCVLAPFWQSNWVHAITPHGSTRWPHLTEPLRSLEKTHTPQAAGPLRGPDEKYLPPASSGASGHQSRDAPVTPDATTTPWNGFLGTASQVVPHHVPSPPSRPTYTPSGLSHSMYFGPRIGRRVEGRWQSLLIRRSSVFIGRSCMKGEVVCGREVRGYLLF